MLWNMYQQFCINSDYLENLYITETVAKCIPICIALKVVSTCSQGSYKGTSLLFCWVSFLWCSLITHPIFSSTLLLGYMECVASVVTGDWSDLIDYHRNLYGVKTELAENAGMTKSRNSASFVYLNKSCKSIIFITLLQRIVCFC